MSEAEKQPTNYRLDESDQQDIETIMDLLPTLTTEYHAEVRARLMQSFLKVAHKGERHGMERLCEAGEAWYKERVLDPKEIDPEKEAREAVFEIIRRREGKTIDDLSGMEYKEALEIADNAIIAGLPDFPHIIVFLNQLADQNSPQEPLDP